MRGGAGPQTSGEPTEKRASDGGWRTTSDLVAVDAERRPTRREKSVGVAPRSGGRCQRSGTLTTGSEIRKREYNKNPKVADYKDGYEVLELMLGD